MSGAQVVRKQAELRLWRALLRETESELQKAFASRNRQLIRQLERECRAIHSEMGFLRELLHAVPRAV